MTIHPAILICAFVWAAVLGYWIALQHYLAGDLKRQAEFWDKYYRQQEIFWADLDVLFKDKDKKLKGDKRVH